MVCLAAKGQLFVLLGVCRDWPLAMQRPWSSVIKITGQQYLMLIITCACSSGDDACIGGNHLHDNLKSNPLSRLNSPLISS